MSTGPRATLPNTANPINWRRDHLIEFRWPSAFAFQYSTGAWRFICSRKAAFVSLIFPIDSFTDSFTCPIISDVRASNIVTLLSKEPFVPSKSPEASTLRFSHLLASRRRPWEASLFKSATALDTISVELGSIPFRFNNAAKTPFMVSKSILQGMPNKKASAADAAVSAVPIRYPRSNSRKLVGRAHDSRARISSLKNV